MAYSYNPYALVSLGTFLLNTAFLVYVLAKNPKARLNRVYSMMLLVFSVWQFFEIFLRLAVDKSTADMWARLAWSSVAFLPPVVLHFSGVLSMEKRITERWYKEAALYLPSVFFLIFVWISNLFINSVVLEWWGWTGYTDTPLFKAFGAYYGIYMLVSLYIVFIAWRQSRVQIVREQMKFAFWGILLAELVGSGSQIIAPALDLPTFPMGGPATLILAIFFGYSMIKYHLFAIESVTEESKREVETRLRLEPGYSYLVKEDTSHNSYEMFRGMVTSIPGLCLTTFYPPKFRQEYNLEKTPIIWLTETQTSEKAVSPYRLDFEIIYTLNSFIKENSGEKGSVVFIDDIEYLSMTNGMEKTLDFIKMLNDIGAANSASVVVPVDPNTFDEKEMGNIESLFDKVIDLRGSPRVGVLGEGMEVKPGYGYLFEDGRKEKIYRLLSRMEKERSLLCISPIFPEKLRKEYGLRGEAGRTEIYWLTDSMEAGEKRLSPARLEFEIADVISSFARENPKGIIFMDAIEGIIRKNNLQKVQDFIKATMDICSVNDCTFLSSLNPKSLEERERSILRKRFDYVLSDDKVERDENL